jgi:hypothetical protein
LRELFIGQMKICCSAFALHRRDFIAMLWLYTDSASGP